MHREFKCLRKRPRKKAFKESTFEDSTIVSASKVKEGCLTRKYWKTVVLFPRAQLKTDKESVCHIFVRTLQHWGMCIPRCRGKIGSASAAHGISPVSLKSAVLGLHFNNFCQMFCLYNVTRVLCFWYLLLFFRKCAIFVVNVLRYVEIQFLPGLCQLAKQKFRGYFLSFVNSLFSLFLMVAEL